MRDKKFERFVGVIPEMIDTPRNKKEIIEEQKKTEEKLISSVDWLIKKIGKKYEGICRFVKETRNYEYDYRVAIFMLLGVKSAPTHELSKLPKAWPFELDKEHDLLTTTWCDAFQSILLLKDNMNIFDDANNDSRLGMFEYHKLMDIQEKLMSKIERDCEEEDRLLCCDGKLDDEQLKKLNRLQSATYSRKENWLLEDMVLGKSLSITLYYLINQIYKKAGIEFYAFTDFIEAVSSLKCFQFRNVIAEFFFQILDQENELTDNKVRDITKNIKKLMELVNQYYNISLTLKWHDKLQDSQLQDKAYFRNFLDIEANSIGYYNVDDDLNSHIIEKNIINIGLYKAELEDDLKKLHAVQYDYINDKDILYIDGLPPLLVSGQMTVDEKKAEILKGENHKLGKAEMDMRITTRRKKITENASALFTFIHWEIMKMFNKSVF